MDYEKCLEESEILGEKLTTVHYEWSRLLYNVRRFGREFFRTAYYEKSLHKHELCYEIRKHLVANFAYGLKIKIKAKMIVDDYSFTEIVEKAVLIEK